MCGRPKRSGRGKTHLTLISVNVNAIQLEHVEEIVEVVVNQAVWAIQTAAASSIVVVCSLCLKCVKCGKSSGYHMSEKGFQKLTLKHIKQTRDPAWGHTEWGQV